MAAAWKGWSASPRLRTGTGLAVVLASWTVLLAGLIPTVAPGAKVTAGVLATLTLPAIVVVPCAAVGTGIEAGLTTRTSWVGGLGTAWVAGGPESRSPVTRIPNPEAASREFFSWLIVILPFWRRCHTAVARPLRRGGIRRLETSRHARL